MRVHVSLSADILAAVDVQSASNGDTRSAFIRRAVLAALVPVSSNGPTFEPTETTALPGVVAQFCVRCGAKADRLLEATREPICVPCLDVADALLELASALRAEMGPRGEASVGRLLEALPRLPDLAAAVATLVPQLQGRAPTPRQFSALLARARAAGLLRYRHSNGGRWRCA